MTRVSVQKKLRASIVSGLLIGIFLLAPISHTFRIQKAEAIFCSNCAQEVTQLVDTAFNKLTSAASVASKVFDGITSKSAAALTFKELTLDKIAYALINTMIQQMSRSIIQWINSGFQGSPAFVTNLKGFLLDVADVTAGKFLTDLGYSAMCSPFKLNIQLSLALQYQGGRQYKPECRLSQVVNNIENFFNGDLVNNGGWSSWLTMTTVQSNNPYGALVEARAAFNVSLSNAQGQELKLLDFGRGFKSLKEIKVCDTDIDGYETDCGITTPGAVIEAQLNNTLDSGRERLVMADEINEVLDALFAQLVKQAFTGIGGLLGLSKGGYTSQGFSYLQAASLPGGTTVGLTENSNNPIVNAITTERSYITFQEDIIQRIDALDVYEKDLFDTNDYSTMPPNLTNARTTAKAGVTSAKANIAELDALNIQYQTEVDPNVQLDLLQDFLTLQTTGKLHTEIQIELARAETLGNEYYGLIKEINDYRAELDRLYEESRRRNNDRTERDGGD